MSARNSSLDDSDAPLARDLRILGARAPSLPATRPQVNRRLGARYGQFVLLEAAVAWDNAVAVALAVRLL